MRLLAFKPRYATDEHRKKGVRVDGWRWAIHTGGWASGWKNGVSIDLLHEILHEKGEEWDPHRGEYFTIAITPHFMLGEDHMYYDGPHCSFSLGFLHFCWSYWWCDKCYKEGTE